MSPAIETRSYRLSPAHVLRAIGPVFVLLGLVWIAVALSGFSTTWARVAIGLSLLAAAGGLVFALRPPTVLRLTETGYQVSWVRGVGTAAGQWRDVSTFGTQPVGDTPALVVKLAGGATTVVPMSLLGANGREIVGEVRRRLDTAHGRRSSGSV